MLILQVSFGTLLRCRPHDVNGHVLKLELRLETLSLTYLNTNILCI